MTSFCPAKRVRVSSNCTESCLAFSSAVVFCASASALAISNAEILSVAPASMVAIFSASLSRETMISFNFASSSDCCIPMTLDSSSSVCLDSNCPCNASISPCNPPILPWRCSIKAYCSSMVIPATASWPVRPSTSCSFPWSCISRVAAFCSKGATILSLSLPYCNMASAFISA